jgi:DCN1-like protein 1/2
MCTDPESDLRYSNVLATDTAQAFWALLLPHGLKGGALSHVHSTDEDEDDDMGEEEGWQPEYVEWWFEFLTQKGGKGVSKDTWVMVCPLIFPTSAHNCRSDHCILKFLDFVRTIDEKFEKYDLEGLSPVLCISFDAYLFWMPRILAIDN